MRLLPQAWLQVSFGSSPVSTSPCDPSAQGGYLGADNQLIRLQIANVNGQPQLLWGYDNASVLYRVSIQDDGWALQLSQPPVDAFHFLTSGQVVEVLRTAVILGTELDETTSQWSIVRCVAEATGFVSSVNTYTSSSNIVTLNAQLPTTYTNDTNPIFLRVWHGQMKINPVSSQTILVQDATDQTGIQVTLSLPSTGNSTGPLPLGAYWMFAVRPATPQAVYPERYLTGPQPPDGPRQWACSLAVIDWVTSGNFSTHSGSGSAVVNPCCPSFENLVTLTNRQTGNELNVTGVVAQGYYGYGMLLQNGQTLTGSQLAQGLLFFLNQSIDPSSATSAACFVSLEVPFLINGMTAGYQSLVLAADVGAANPGVITWSPMPGSQQFLLNELPLLLLSGTPVSHDWDLSSTGTPAVVWSYAANGLQANMPTSGSGGTVMAISKQPLQAGVGTLRLSVSPPTTPIGNQFSVGLIFNFLSVSDYWLLMIFLGSEVIGEGEGGYSILNANLTHFQSGTTTSTPTTVGDPGVIPQFTNIDFTITQSSRFSATVDFTSQGSSFQKSTQINLPTASPPTLAAGSQVGLYIADWPGTSDFTSFVMSPKSGSSQNFLQPSGLKILGRLQVKRDFLQPAGAITGPATLGSPVPTPRTDFSMWFWLQSAVVGSAYGSGGIEFGGVGLCLIWSHED